VLFDQRRDRGHLVAGLDVSTHDEAVRISQYRRLVGQPQGPILGPLMNCFGFD